MIMMAVTVLSLVKIIRVGMDHVQTQQMIVLNNQRLKILLVYVLLDQIIRDCLQ